VWGRRLSTILILGFAVAAAIGWGSVNYFHRSPGLVESFRSDDGWCDPAVAGVGVHCFGDFALPNILVAQGDAWPGHIGASPGPVNPYSALGMTPNVLANQVAQTPIGPRGSLFIYLVLLALALLAPALWAVLAGRGPPRNWLPLLVIGVASGPFLTTMDRGNSIGFAVPLILLFALFIRRNPAWVAPVAVIAAAAVRPQFVLLALALVAFGRWRAALYAVLGAVASGLLAFAVWPGGMVSNIQEWLGDIQAFQAGVDPAADTPINVSAAHSVATLGQWLGHAPGFVGDAGTGLVAFIRQFPSLPGVLIALAVGLTLLCARGRVPQSLVLTLVFALPALIQGVAYSYSLIFALVLAALVLGPTALAASGHTDNRVTGLFDDLATRGRAWRLWAWVVVVAIALSVVPITLSIDALSQSLVKGQAGLVWLVVVVGGIVLAWSSIGNPLSARHRPAPQHLDDGPTT